MMLRRTLFAVALVSVISSFDVPSRAASSDGPKLPSLPSVPRVRLDVTADHVVVTQEVNLPRGEWAGGDLDLFVAFGAPGLPIGIDATLVALADGAIESNPKDVGEPIPLDRAAHRPSHASLLLGSPRMAGVVLHVKEPAFRRATSPGKMAAIRIRSLLRLPEKDAFGGREVIVRLGLDDTSPLTLGRLQIAIDGLFVHRVEAHFCGPDADDYPLSIATLSKLTPLVDLPTDIDLRPPAAPVLAVRHASDNLCIRMW
ncbi:MAG: hypothetical protein ABI461_18080 [Polyangiaceae bacterium]